ncbi:MAG TPA: sialidase family protein, partial [Bacteroidota bacterium]|nr:sialidase family protein [Bacteroidota bacterium]
MKTFLSLTLYMVGAVCYAQWQPDFRLTNDPGASTTSQNNAWCIAASGDVVHAVWYDDRAGNLEVFYKRSTDRGASWQADVQLTHNTGFSYQTSIGASGSIVHLVWRDNVAGNDEIYYKRSTDAGITWQPDSVRLTNSTGQSACPSLAVAGSTVHVVWHDNRDGNYEIYYKRSTDEGLTWAADSRLTNNTSTSQYPSVAVAGQAVYAVWQDNRDGNDEIYYTRSTDGGLTWQPDVRLTNNTLFSRYPSVAASGVFVHVLWQDFRDGNWRAYYKRSSDGGTTWQADSALTDLMANSQYLSVVAVASAVHLVWREQRDGNNEIYYKRSTDNGATWEADVRLTNNTAISREPSVAVGGQTIHVIWHDLRDGNYEVYYKRNPTGNPTDVRE